MTAHYRQAETLLRSKAVIVAQAEETSELTATRDPKALVEATLLDSVGERRGRFCTRRDHFEVVAIGHALDVGRPRCRVTERL